MNYKEPTLINLKQTFLRDICCGIFSDKTFPKSNRVVPIEFNPSETKCEDHLHPPPPLPTVQRIMGTAILKKCIPGR